MNEVGSLHHNKTGSLLSEKELEMKAPNDHQQEDVGLNHTVDDRLLSDVKEEEEVPHLWGSGPDQQSPELLIIKKEEEDLWSSQEGEQLPVKSEDDESRRFLQLRQIKTENGRETESPTFSSAEQIKTETGGEDCGGPEPGPAGSQTEWKSAAPVAGPAASDEEDSEASSASQHAPGQEKATNGASPAAADGDRQYFWRDGHQDTMAEFWLGHPVFYDKAQQHYKDKEMKLRLMQELIRQNSEDWEKLQSPLPTVTQVDAHLRNMRTRFVKLLKRKSAAPGLILSYTDQKIWERYHFLRPYIQRGRTSAAHSFPGVQPGGDDAAAAAAAAAAEGDVDDKTLLWSQQPSTSKLRSKKKGKKKLRTSVTSPLSSSLLDSEDMSKMEILQQAKNLICNIRTPARSDHERRVRDFSRYMESEMLRIPESSWDECSFTIMNVIRGFKAAQQPGHLALPQQPAYQQSYGGQYQQQGGYYPQQSGTF